jgi:deoxyribonuclease-4
MILGAHVGRGKVLEEASKTRSEVIQIFMGPPRSWNAPVIKGDEGLIKDSGLLVYVHASYLVNPASLNKEVREQSRRYLEAYSKAAVMVGARGLIVHGGHPTGSGTVDDGIAGWLEVMDGLELPTRILIENTAGGGSAVARKFDSFKKLYTSLKNHNHDIGICLDTCHAHAGGEELSKSVATLRSFAGSIDLVHANDSKDSFNSGRDRHENLGGGMCGLEAVAQVVREAGCPAVVETPGGVEAMAVDIENLKKVDS